MLAALLLACATAVVDLDGDGADAAADCDDGDAAVHAGAAERCNGIDDDCDGDVDEGLTDAAAWFTDADDDGHGDAGTERIACSPVVGQVAVGDDCDDGDARVWPGAPEACDGVDQDCDGAVDEGAPGTAWWYPDADGDGAGGASGAWSCGAPDAGWVESADDCDDADAAVLPGAPDTPYDGVDGDCAGDDDFDVDGDGYAGAGVGADDCDDQDPGVSPAAIEVCANGVDDDCDGGAPTCGPAGDGMLGDGATYTHPDNLGLPPKAAHDLDGDGVAEVVFANYGAASYGGQVWGVTVAAASDVDVSAGLFTVSGEPGLELGRSVAVGDTDGDGVAELHLGSMWAGDRAGAWFSVEAPTGAIALAESDAVEAGAVGEYLGYAMDVGDLTGDGVDDLLVGGHAWERRGVSVGRVIVATTEAFVLLGSEEGTSTGRSIDVLPDVDGDGFTDLAVGNGDGAWIVHGPLTGTVAYSDAEDALVMSLEAPVHGAGDLDGDGLGDVLVGDGVGASVFRGPLTGRLTTADAWAEARPPSGAGLPDAWTTADVNGDGADDVVLTAPDATGALTYQGLVAIWSGPIAAGTHEPDAADARLWGPSLYARAGYGVLAVGDVDGDGPEDLLVQGNGVSWGVLGGPGW